MPLAVLVGPEHGYVNTRPCRRLVLGCVIGRTSRVGPQRHQHRVDYKRLGRHGHDRFVLFRPFQAGEHLELAFAEADLPHHDYALCPWCPSRLCRSAEGGDIRRVLSTPRCRGPDRSPWRCLLRRGLAGLGRGRGRRGLIGVDRLADRQREESKRLRRRPPGGQISVSSVIPPVKGPARDSVRP